jgi:hypothetical protein
MADFEKIIIAIIVLALIAVIIGSGKTVGFIQSASGFLVAMVNKVQGNT